MRCLPLAASNPDFGFGQFGYNVSSVDLFEFILLDVPNHAFSSNLRSFFCCYFFKKFPALFPPILGLPSHVRCRV